jgi:Kef-type K+ transport system membrane component KefB
MKVFVWPNHEQVQFHQDSRGLGAFEVDAPLSDPFGLFLVQCVIILSMTRVLGLAGSYLRLPKVIFEIVGGVLLGPSAIGRNKAYMTTIFPKSSLPLLNVVAQLGLVLYLFVVGMELDPKLIASHGRKAGAIAFFGMAVPFALGVGISQIMFDTLQANDPKYSKVPFVSFYVFIGTAMSITAFPVLARILKEGALIYTKPGAMAMGAAALNDAVAWCLLILAISIAHAGEMASAGIVFACVVTFGLGLIFIVRPVYWWLVAWVERRHSVALNNSLFCLTLILVFLSSWTTELLGVHAIFGSFLFGLIVPRDSHLFTECNDKIEELVLTLTLPLYFALSGLQTDVTTISSGAEGAMVVLVCFVATIGKYIGAGGAAYAGGSSVRESFVIAFLMNTRGLVELIVLNLGMQAGVLSIRTFSVMVIMCLFTTFITGPMVEWIYPPHIRGLETGHLHEETIGLVSKTKDHDIESGGATPLIEEATMDVMAKEVRLTVLVDRIEHLQGMMEVVSCFIPSTRDSSLRVVAIKAHEPSLTDKDEFIGLNNEGRLIHVQSESTSYHANYARFVSASMGGKIEPQELLPLSMFLKAVGSEVEAYRMRGDPAGEGV